MITMISAVLVGMINSDDICDGKVSISDSKLAWQVPGMTLILEGIVELILLLRWFFKKIKKR